MSSPFSRAYYRLRRPVYRGYQRLVRANYDARAVATPTATVAGRFRSYDLYNPHHDDPMLAALDDACGPSAVVYDIGANVGSYSLALAADAPDRRVLAFEAVPRLAERLRANVACNDFEDRITVEACGVGDADGTATVYRSTYAELSGFDRESATRWGAAVAEARAVPVSRLDTLVEEYPPPDVIKIDVEGAAPAVLRGASETLVTHRPTLFVEVHEAGLSASTAPAVREQLREANYAITERGEYWRCEPRD